MLAYSDVDGALCDVQVLGADLAGVPLLLPVEGVGDLGPKPGRVVDGPLVHLSVLMMRIMETWNEITTLSHHNHRSQRKQ